MTFKEFIRDNPNRKLILLWFDENTDTLMQEYCKSNRLSSKARRMIEMEVMETETFDDEDWIEVWLR